ncbi:bifunctional diguanylate cyclase/phosphodiesterase [Noviherbaspirillum soli]|uniref:bifunctional diguanylate cyclase/phosphodiesterase n=1 Tax=Noviherbaspirillum soli TaxID=1064518 RepID=UPI00188D517F|nr:EAL domain-containing protein [Noviherbaspirillum soli]
MFPSSKLFTAPHAPALPPRPRLCIAAIALLAVMVLCTALALTASYHDTLRQEANNLRNLATAFSAQTASAAYALDRLLDNAREDYLESTAPRDSKRPAMRRPPLPRDVLGISLLDRDGHLLTGSPLPPDMPANAVPGPDDTLAITISAIDAASGRGILTLGRPLLDDGGRRIGAMVARIDSAYFVNLYAQVALDSGGSITLMHGDGTMLARGPAAAGAVGRSFAATPLFQTQLPASAAGTFEATSPTHGVRRIYGYSKVRNYPLVTIAGMDKEDALAFWHERVAIAVGLLGLATLSLSVMAWRISRDAARRSALIEKLGASEARLARSADYLGSILGAIASPVYVLDSQRRFVLVNDAYCRFAGKRREELLGRLEQETPDAHGAGEREQTYAQVLAGAGDMVDETEVVDSAGELRTFISTTSRLISDTGEAQIVCVRTDISERKMAEVRLAYLADFDLLTELPNQARFLRTLDAEIHAAAASGECVGVLALSLERLQEIIDLMGHAAGDTLLRQVAQLLRQAAPDASLARTMSNQFALSIRCDDGRGSLAAFAARLHGALSDAMPVGQRDFYLGPAIGIASSSDDGSAAEELLRRADVARHRAAGEGQDAVQFFSESSHLVLDERLAMESQLRQALQRGELRLVYQPKVDIPSGRVTGFEALLRWTSPVLGDVPPTRFIPIAEASGAIVSIGAWVVEEACRQMRAWQDSLGQQVKVAVNLSPRQFHRDALVPMLRQCLAASSIAPGSLELEITESTVMASHEDIDVLLHDIRSLGVDIAIDDFGTGYSSLAYLKRLPAQCLKIDRAFIRDLGHDEDSLAIVRTIVSLCHGLKMTVVAEGVETPRQLELLRELGCHAYQGYLFSRPLEAEAVPLLLRARNAAAAPAGSPAPEAGAING